MHQFGWVSERDWGGVTFLICFRKREVPSEKGGEVPTLEETLWQEEDCLQECGDCKKNEMRVFLICAIIEVYVE